MAQQMMVQNQDIRGIGMTSARTRDRLVLFVDEALASRAYEDTALPLGLGQTISQPYVVAKMTEALLQEFEGERVLEIGTGCGYQTAMLAPLVKEIYTVERIPELLKKTKQRLRQLDIYNVHYRLGDGWEGWPKYAPYDGIIVAAAAPEFPEKLLQQLKQGGRMVIPVGPTGRQELVKLTKQNGHYEQLSLGLVSFVPLIHGKSE
jgi:protein-L-isoaspartate(D-aspartate) O-methyltransferase